MKLTKLQRHTAYIIMLVEAKLNIRTGEYIGVCEMTKEVFDINNNNIVRGGMFMWAHNLNYFPELKKKEPKHYGALWFDYSPDGWRSRVKLIKQCIQETY